MSLESDLKTVNELNVKLIELEDKINQINKRNEAKFGFDAWTAFDRAYNQYLKDKVTK